MTGRIFLLCAVLTAATPATADPAVTAEGPWILPKQDVAVEYRTRGMMRGPLAGNGHRVTARFDSREGRIRIDGPDSRFYAILDVASERMIMVMPEWRLYMEQPADPDLSAILHGANTRLRPLGDEEIAGLTCTAYDAALNDRTGELCLTDDGVLLRAEIADRGRPRELEALRVTYADQPDSYFHAPADFTKVDMSDLPPGLNLGVGGPPRGGYSSGR